MGLITGKQLRVKIAFDNYCNRVEEDSLLLKFNTSTSSVPDATQDFDIDGSYDIDPDQDADTVARACLQLFSGCTSLLELGNITESGIRYKAYLEGAIEPYTDGATQEEVNVVAIPYSYHLADPNVTPDYRGKVKIFDDNPTEVQEVKISTAINTYTGLADADTPLDLDASTEDLPFTKPIFWETFDPVNLKTWRLYGTNMEYSGLFIGKTETYTNVKIAVSHLKDPKQEIDGKTNTYKHSPDGSSSYPALSSTANRQIKIDFKFLTAAEAAELMRGIELHGLRAPVFVNCYSGENSPREKSHTFLGKISDWSDLKLEKDQTYSLSITFTEDT